MVHPAGLTPRDTAATGTMAASMMNSKMQSSFLGSSLRTQRPFVPSRASPVAGTVVAAYGNKLNPGGGKPWERTEVNKNGKPVKVKMHVKAGDIVQVQSSFSCCAIPHNRHSLAVHSDCPCGPERSSAHS